ncbi:MAG: HAD-IC family P-type ATPase [Actinomycetaceae bacterium]|nr:HAD-IC family P-type ATPase [Actinomycetaceae bacterium]
MASNSSFSNRILVLRLIVALVLSIPVMFLSMIPAWQFPGWQWFVAVLALPVVTWCSWPFYVGGIPPLRHGVATMDTQVTLGIVASALWSYYALLFTDAGTIGMKMEMMLIPRFAPNEPHIYFEGATMVAAFILVGRYMEARAKHTAGSALRDLLKLGASEASRVSSTSSNAIEEVVPIDQLQVNDLFKVRPGDKIATDGIVVAGQGSIDESMLTGEPLAVHATVDDEVTGGTINTSGTLVVKATKIGKDTALAQIAKLVADAQAGKAPIQRLADRIAGVFVPIVLTLAVLTFFGWAFIGGSMQAAITSAVAVLAGACACALGLATPTALLVASGRASQLGIVLKGPEVLESSQRVTTIVLDKTGTITKGEMKVITGDDNAISKAASVEKNSEHGLAHAIVDYAKDNGLAVHQCDDFRNFAGRGVDGIVGDERVIVGKPEFLVSCGIEIDSDTRTRITDLEDTGATVVCVAKEVIADTSGEGWTDQCEDDDVCADQINSGTLGEKEDLLTMGSVAAQANQSVCTTSKTKQDSPSKIFKTRIQLDIEGMTCAACVSRVEKNLSECDGVDEALVNLATESATVDVDSAADAQKLVDAVVKAGYKAQVASEEEVEVQKEINQAQIVDDENPDYSKVSLEGIIAVRDEIRETSQAAIDKMHEMGLETLLVTGDNKRAASYVSKLVGIDSFRAGVLPSQKRDVIVELQTSGKNTAMVGDGINDAAALAQSSNQGIGMAMGTGTDVAINASDITLVRSDLEAVTTALSICRKTVRIIKQNLAWAFSYNFVVIPLAMAGLVNPMLAGLIMAMSSVLVVANSLRLRYAH